MTIGIQVGTVLGVAVAESCRTEPLAVVVDHHRTEHDLVASVPVHIGYLEVVVALSEVGRRTAVLIPAPPLGQLVGQRIHVQGTELVAGVAATAQKDAGMASVQEWCTEVVLRRAVASVGLAPDGGVVALAVLKAWQRIGHRRIVLAGTVPVVGLARLAVQVEQVLCPLMGIFIARCHITHITHVDSLPRSRVNHHIVGTTHQALSLAVLVPVKGYQVPLLVGACHQVGTQVNPPQPLARDGIALIMVEVGRIGRRVQVAAGIIALDDELHGAVAVDIAQRDVVDLILRRHVLIITVGHAADGDVLILGIPAGHLSRLFLFDAPYHGSHLILRRTLTTSIDIVRHLERCAVHERPVTIEVIFRVVVFFAQDLPTDEVT